MKTSRFVRNIARSIMRRILWRALWRALRHFGISLALVLALYPAGALAQIDVCTSEWRDECFPVRATYATYSARPGELVTITIAAEDIPDASAGELVLAVPNACRGASEYQADPQLIVVERGLGTATTWQVPANSQVDPCQLSILLLAQRCVGPACAPLPGWVTAEREIFVNVDLQTSILRFLRTPVLAWALALMLGAYVGSEVARRMVVAVHAFVETSESAERVSEQTRENDDERGEWDDTRTA